MDLQRFVDAQDGVYDAVLQELGAGRKRSHWMWFVFPQIAGLGHSATARRYAIATIEEAAAFAAHPVLGPRLVECVTLVLDIHGKTAEQIFGYPDYLKFRSCLSLFDAIGAPGPFREALDRYYGGEPDPRTLEIIAGMPDGK